MGSHTDYNGGRVLAIAIDRAVWIAARRRTDRRVEISSEPLAERVRFDLDAIRDDQAVRILPRWARYVAGVIVVLGEVECELTDGFDAVVASDLPMAAGLSSSAALTSATAVLVERLANRPISRETLARCCQQVEHRFVGVPCGILDPYCSLFGTAGRAIEIDCRQLRHRPVPLPTDVQILVADTCVPRALADSAYSERRAACESALAAIQRRVPSLACLADATIDDLARVAQELPEPVVRHARFVIAEDRRVRDLSDGLAAGDCRAAGRLMEESFVGARDDYEICIPEMEVLWQTLRRSPGYIGARQAGAGFGGCLVALCDAATTAAFCAAVNAASGPAGFRQPRLLAVSAAPGAAVAALPHRAG
jgi:galactokinase